MATRRMNCDPRAHPLPKNAGSNSFWLLLHGLIVGLVIATNSVSKFNEGEISKRVTQPICEIQYLGRQGIVVLLLRCGVIEFSGMLKVFVPVLYKKVLKLKHGRVSNKHFQTLFQQLLTHELSLPQGSSSMKTSFGSHLSVDEVWFGLPICSC
jgi:hypothetical protein